MPAPATAASLDAFRNGDPHELRRIYKALAPAVYHYLLRRLRSSADAADLTQDVFIVAFSREARRRFSGRSTLDSFILGVARNRLLHHLRNARRRAELRSVSGLDVNDRVEAGVMDGVVEREVTEVVEGYLMGLEERDRAFFQQHLIERPPRRATADSFGMTIDQVRYLESKLRQGILARLKEAGHLGEQVVETCTVPFNAIPAFGV